MPEWVIVNGHVLGGCAYLDSLERPWEPEAYCDCFDDENDVYEDEPGDLAYEGSW